MTDEATAIEETVASVSAAHGNRPDALIEILHGIQDRHGFVPEAVIAPLAEALNVTRAEVHGVISFYHDFRREPGGRHTVRVCRAEACQARGCEALAAHAERRLGTAFEGTTADGAFTLKAVYCLGDCAIGPAVMIDDELYGRVDADRLDALLEARAAGGGAAQTGTAAGPGTVGGADPVAVYVPADAAALSVGADDVAAAVAAEAERCGAAVRIVRNGSRGLLWLEPLVEVETESGRLAYGPVGADDVPGLFDAGFLEGGDHKLAHGPTEEIDWLRRQERLTFARCGVIDPLSIDDYRSHGGFAGLEKALAMKPADIVAELTESGLRGRGGAGFPAGIKWKTVLEAEGDEKYVCCNADEGDSGTFADRMLMEGDPFTLIEGMTIAGIATGATRGLIYIRSEYPHAIRAMKRAIALAEEAGYLGDRVAGSDRAFTLAVRVGAGSYVCGEETAMLESLEGRRGMVRAKPPIPALSGLFGKPTVVNNVLTFAAAPLIVEKGGAFYHGYGTGRSRGTQPFQLAGNVRRGGLVEKPFGLTLAELIEDFGGGTESGRPVRAVQVGGPLGAYLPAALLHLPLDYEALLEAEAMLGHGGVVVFDDTVDMAAQARFAMAFCAIESCGKCTPCRVGAVRGAEVIDRIVAGTEAEKNLGLLNDLCEIMTDGSLCALGGLTPMPVRSALAHFPEDFRRPSGTHAA